MITITMKAEEKIRELMQEEKETIGLRVYVKGGGCHGYQYGMSLESTTGEDDTVVEHGVVKVIMDSQSAPLLVGTEVDYVDSMQGSGFVMKNPQAKTTCGCGSSFSA
ncbi:MAG: iron-sulfur cluster insertion protein ErpA [Nitrospira sp.]|nr:MAG: iron-sulfur cluster insertion protein ErpA [Nitrospira sp.]